MQLSNLTSRVLPALLGLLLCSSVYAHNTIIFEEFKDAKTSYTTIPAESVKHTTDYLTRAEGSIINTDISLTATPGDDPSDNEPPVAVCAPSGTVTVALDENGMATVNAQSLDGGSTDNVGIASFQASPATFDCGDIGSQQVTLTVTDTNGNTATCATTVQVVDLLGPVLSVNESITVILDANGNATIDANMIDNGTSDNCGISSISVSTTSFDCSSTTNLNPIASDLIISEYVDGSDNNKYIEIYNGTGVAVDMADYFLELYSNGDYSTNLSDNLGAAGILENGETAVFSNSQASLYSGTHYNTSVADFDGNDLLLLFHSYGDYGTAIDAFGVADGNTDPSWELGGVSSKGHTLRRKKSVVSGNIDSSNPNFLSEWEQFDSNDVSDLGNHNFEDTHAQVIFSATDNSGNTSTKSIAVYVVDNIAPQFLTQPDDIVIPADPYGNCAQYLYYTYPEVADNCSGEVIITSDYPSGDVFFGGETLVTLTATDAGGNTDQVQFLVTILYDPLTVSIGSINDTICSNYPLVLTAHAMGGCDTGNYSWNGKKGGSTLQVDSAGTYHVFITDANGDTASTSITTYPNPPIELEFSFINSSCADSSGASVSVVSISGGTGPYQYYWFSSQITEETGLEYLNNVPSLTDLNLGKTIIFLVRDTVGCEEGAKFRPMLEDLTPPIAICGSTTLILDAGGTAMLDPADLDGGSTDDCSASISFSASIETFDCTHLGVNEVTLYVADDSLNTSTCQAYVTVIDNLPPDLIVNSSVNFILDNAGEVVLNPSAFDNGSTDNCELSLSVSKDQFDCSDLGENELILTGTDASGNTSSSSVFAIILDNTAPNLVAKNIEVQLDANGSAHVNAADIDNGSFDNCGIASLEITSGQVDYTCADIGQTFAVTLTAIDHSGNTSSQIAQVTVVDNTGLVFTSFPENIAAIADAATCSAIVTWAQPEASNTCAATLTSDHHSGDAFPLGTTTVTYIAADLSGNSISQSFTITISTEDVVVSIAKVQDILCHGGTTELTAVVSGGCQPYAYIWDGAAGGESLSANVGVHTLTVTDANGVTASANITLAEPSALEVTLVVTEAGCPESLNGYVKANVSGGTAPYTVQWSGDATGSGNILWSVGAGTYTATVTDNNGCTVVDSAPVSDLDITPPNAACINTTLWLKENGQATLDPVRIDPGSTDNCGYISLSTSKSTFDCSNLGANEILLIVTDASGLTSTCTSIITILDEWEPVAVVQDINVSLDASGYAHVEAVDIDNGSFDNCGIATLEITSGQVAYGCADEGQTFAVTLTATDYSGNTSSAVAQVTVLLGDGNCDPVDSCPGAETIVSPDQPCDYQTTISTSILYASGYQNYCVNGPFTNNFIYIESGTTVRLTGTGTLNLLVSSNAAVEVMAGSDITINAISFVWNARGMVVNPGATVHMNNFEPGEPVVNCGTINCNGFTLGYDAPFLNNGTLNCSFMKTSMSSTFINNGVVNATYFQLGYGSDFENNGMVYASQANGKNKIDGKMVNNGTVDVAGKLDLPYNGSIENHCTINVGKDFNIDRNVTNYSFISVAGKSKLSYNGRVKLYNGAMFQTGSTKIDGRYIGYGSASLVKVANITQAGWNGRIEGSLYFCDANGLESVSNPYSLFQGGALESCNLTISVTDCNPIGHFGSPLGMIVRTDNDAAISDATFLDDTTTPEVPITNIHPQDSNAQESHAQESRNAITVFPNPTQGKAQITFTPLHDASVTISVYNVRGKKVQEFKPSEQIAGQPYVANLDISKYENGVYLIQIMDQTRSETRKLVLAK